MNSAGLMKEFENRNFGRAQGPGVRWAWEAKVGDLRGPISFFHTTKLRRPKPLSLSAAKLLWPVQPGASIAEFRTFCFRRARYFPWFRDFSDALRLYPQGKAYPAFKTTETCGAWTSGPTQLHR